MRARPLVVVAISALVLVGCSKKMAEAQARQAQVDVEILATVSEKWRIEHPGACPTVDKLRADKELAPSSKTSDPWGQPYRIDCGGDRVVVTSDGPDGKPGTSDDVTSGKKP